MEVYQFVFLIVMFSVLCMWLHLLSRIGNSTLLVLQEINDWLPEGELDGLGHGADDEGDDEAENGDGQRRNHDAVICP